MHRAATAVARCVGPILGLSVLLATLTGCCCSLSDEQLAEIRREREQREAEQAERDKVRAEKEAAEKAAREAAEQARWEALPKTERAFCEVLAKHAAEYKAATNDLKRSAVRAKRAKALRAAVPNGWAERWVGTVRTLTTTSEGEAVLELTLPCSDYAVGTWNNSFSDIEDGTLIKRGSSMFNSLSEMSVGDEIWVSGRLIRNDVNGWKGTALTEAGSMSGDFFLMKF